MTQRERTLSIVLTAFIVVAGSGFFGYQFILAPLQSKDSQIAQVQDDIQNRLLRVNDILKRKRTDLVRWSRESLPADIELARREYRAKLDAICRESGFEVASTLIVPKPPDNKTVQKLPNKTPVYTKLPFQVTLKGDMLSLVEWMDRFYKLPLLHQIRNLTIARPLSTGAAARGGAGAANDLEINMTVEALVLDTAENRKTLLPEKAGDAQVLATTDRKYGAIAGKNVFAGPPALEQRARSVDVTPFVKLDSITANEGGPKATLYDQYHNHDYEIKPRSSGGFDVQVSYYIQNRKRPLRRSTDSSLELHDAEGNVERSWKVVRIDIDRSEVILRRDEKYYRLHTGWSLAELQSLSKDEVTALGLKDQPAAGAKEESSESSSAEAAKKP
jgi:hypothetical protein